eukprot:6868218-Prymnesium_polylepis.1
MRLHNHGIARTPPPRAGPRQGHVRQGKEAWVRHGSRHPPADGTAGDTRSFPRPSQTAHAESWNSPTPWH